MYDDAARLVLGHVPFGVPVKCITGYNRVRAANIVEGGYVDILEGGYVDILEEGYVDILEEGYVDILEEGYVDM
jgi:hypothetical protein